MSDSAVEAGWRPGRCRAYIAKQPGDYADGRPHHCERNLGCRNQGLGRGKRRRAGLATGADTLEELVEKLKIAIPEVLAENGIPFEADNLPFKIEAERSEYANAAA
jgi:hypothetical protein